ncbi:MAG: hypothetical protein IJQ41_03675, partial [Firmicutes bacterium]|nr:hypothetical protein [Bacillota bacterium]
MSKEELEQAMQERRAKRAKAKARHERKSSRGAGASIKDVLKKPERPIKAEQEETPARKPARKVRTHEAEDASSKKGFRPFACLLLGPIFALFEILLSVLTKSGFLHVGVLHALALGLILGALCSLLPKKTSYIAEM